MDTLKKRIVTGYIPIQGHPRGASEYGELGEKVFGHIDCAGTNTIIHPFYENVQETWLAKLIRAKGFDCTHSTADNPQKNTLAYHCVQHQKFAWLLKAAIADPSPDVFIWLDYGLGHIGITPAQVDTFLKAVRADDFAIPGCWPREGLMINDYWPCWRFCGGVMVVPRSCLHKLYKTVKADVTRHILTTGNVSWEVNSLARVEPTLPIRWYAADHDKSLLENYDAAFRSEPRAKGEGAGDLAESQSGQGKSNPPPGGDQISVDPAG